MLNVRKITCAVGANIMLFLAISLARLVSLVSAFVAIALDVHFAVITKMVAVRKEIIELLRKPGVHPARKFGHVPNVVSMRTLWRSHRWDLFASLAVLR